MIATFHHRDFPLRTLLRLKGEQGAVISCVVPTLNEEATIAQVIAALRKNPLTDEVVVVDSGSEDATLARAREAGAAVHLASSIRPELGPARGKGENLWKSLFVTRGGILVFIDGDLRHPHPRYVTGLAGPLLAHEGVSYVKAFYKRRGGGGRVTEILARPLLRQFFPDLAPLLQPLAGEYAARRSLLAQLPFPTGYSVEMAHLLDVAQHYGTGCLAQCGLGSRTHRTRPLEDLGVMSEGILRTVVARLRARGIMAADAPGNAEAEMERPPADSLAP